MSVKSADESADFILLFVYICIGYGDPIKRARIGNPLSSLTSPKSRTLIMNFICSMIREVDVLLLILIELFPFTIQTFSLKNVKFNRKQTSVFFLIDIEESHLEEN